MRAGRRGVRAEVVNLLCCKWKERVNESSYIWREKRERTCEQLGSLNFPGQDVDYLDVTADLQAS